MRKKHETSKERMTYVRNELFFWAIIAYQPEN